MNALVILGEPGAGKTTLAAHLVRDLPYETFEYPFAHRRVDPAGVIVLGKDRPGGFGGTDALSMSVQPRVLEWLAAEKPKLLFFEGDRLSNDSMFKALRELGYAIALYEVWGSRVAAAQRAARGSSQNAAWLAGRLTKVRGLRSRWKPVILAAGQPVEVLASKMDDPVSLALREVRT